MIQWVLSWPTWHMTRIFGIAAYLLLFGGMAHGMLYGYPFAKGPLKAKLHRWHTRLTGGGVIVTLLHAFILMIDTYSPFTAVEILVPFTARSHPFWYGLGTLAMYGMLVLMLSSDMRPKLKRPLWIAIHMLSYPIYLIALLHGIKVGTDASHPLVQAMYIATFVITLGLFGGRMFLRSSSAAGGIPKRTPRRTG
ncbi:ferric reductase [Paenibacillus sp. YIM B09110]|uniref:ferric reductase n=1 Tax=Paenibacillus sp. YIM B09110 TaxID=3126102 RepID=UPI00301CAAC9